MGKRAKARKSRAQELLAREAWYRSCSDQGLPRSDRAVANAVRAIVSGEIFWRAQWGQADHCPSMPRGRGRNGGRLRPGRHGGRRVRALARRAATGAVVVWLDHQTDLWGSYGPARAGSVEPQPGPDEAWAEVRVCSPAQSRRDGLGARAERRARLAWSRSVYVSEVYDGGEGFVSDEDIDPQDTETVRSYGADEEAGL